MRDLIHLNPEVKERLEAIVCFLKPKSIFASRSLKKTFNEQFGSQDCSINLGYDVQGSAESEMDVVTVFLSYLNNKRLILHQLTSSMVTGQEAEDNLKALAERTCKILNNLFKRM